MPHDYTLLVTQRALTADLDLPAQFSGTDVREIIAQLIEKRLSEAVGGHSPTDTERHAAMAWVHRNYEVLVKFDAQRRYHPIGQEPTQNLTHSAGRIWSLHATRQRGVTWHDEGRGIVWLCAARWHESGSQNDAYKWVESLDANDLLLPTPAEIADSSVLSQPEVVLDALPGLLAEALQSPGVEYRWEVHRADRPVGGDGVAAVAVSVFLVEDALGRIGEAFVGVRSLVPDPPSELLAACLLKLFPQAELADYRFPGAFPGRPALPGEIIAAIDLEL